MHIEQNVSLKPYNTFAVEAQAAYFTTVSSEAELIDAVFYARTLKLPLLILGGGSNVLFTKDFYGLVIHNAIKGISTSVLDAKYMLLSSGAGENWHQVVTYSLNSDLGGLENLSLIPGTVGAAPMQNIGAYGVELKDVFHSLEALHIPTLKIKNFCTAECRFGYRESVFKNELKDQYIITRVNMLLTRPGHHQLHTSYGTIQAWLDAHQITAPTIHDVSKAVIAIRQSKLPDPTFLGNAGSFFKNPTISSSQYELLKSKFPDIPGYAQSSDWVKVPAGWLIEQAGFKGKTFGKCGVHKYQALVLVNYGGATGAEILAMAQEIKHTVSNMFGIELHTEVNII